MKSFVISDDQDALIGMRLAGVKGVMVTKREEVLKELDKLVKDDDVKIIIITESVLDMAKNEIMELKLRKGDLLVVEIPNGFGSKRGDYITKYIRDSLGLKL
ncbi:MAG: V-type ATP synthase subunit F [Alkaliphilus sp.]|mgnify:CR=1 FL=1|nr:V-type ATP synthase subunit F [Alkaliphilus sp.]